MCILMGGPSSKAQVSLDHTHYASRELLMIYGLAGADDSKRQQLAATQQQEVLPQVLWAECSILAQGGIDVPVHVQHGGGGLPEGCQSWR